MMRLRRYRPIAVLIAAGLVCGSISFTISQRLQLSERVDTGVHEDVLSGTSYGPHDTPDGPDALNPFMPSYRGFALVSEKGLDPQVVADIQDAAAQYVLYDRGITGATVSYVRDSLKLPHEGDGKNLEFSLRFGINGGDVHGVEVRQDMTRHKNVVTIRNAAGYQVLQHEYSQLDD